MPEFTALDDPALLQYTQDSIIAEIEAAFDNDDVQVEDVQSTYVSKEYLEELDNNSKQNVFFGYTLKEIASEIGSQKYVFTVGEDGHTVIQAFEEYDDTYDRAIRNMAIGSGVILVCVVVTVATGGAGAPVAMHTVNTVFAASAKTAASFAMSSGVMGAAAAGIATGYQTGDMDKALKAAALEGSKGFMWGAITGAIAGGAGKAFRPKTTRKSVPSWKDSEEYVLKKYRGDNQVSFMNGKEVSWGTPGSTRPDVVAKIKGVKTSIEVKNYDLVNNLPQLKSKLKMQLMERKMQLPKDYAQKVIIDVRKKGYSRKFIRQCVSELKEMASKIDPTITIEVLR
ncbi:MAG: hypothetical protein IKF14_02905 [Atopobiaceae bacterium]|nr:hypothetical protein [Atopobiaceae bacterium]